MTPYTPQEVEEHFQRLPEPLKEAMMSVENSERIFEVGKKFALTVEQIGFLAEESGYVVLGLTHPQDFVARIEQHLRVDADKAKNIAQEINHKVFFPLREALKSAHQFELTQEQIQQPPPPIPAAPRAPVPPAAIPVTPTLKPAMPSVTPVSPLEPAMPSAAPPIILKPAPVPLAPQSTPAKVLPKVTAPAQPPASPPPVPPARPSVPPPLPPLVLSTIQERKPGPSAQPATPAAPIAPRSAEGIKPKEPMTPPLPPAQPPALNPPDGGSGEPQSGFSPLAPSQIMQKKFLQERDMGAAPARPEIQRMKESLFAAPSAPAESPHAPQQNPAQQPAPPPIPPPQAPPTPVPPTVRRGNDPYREPLD